jgi:protein-disulfide isomerase
MEENTPKTDSVQETGTEKIPTEKNAAAVGGASQSGVPEAKAEPKEKTVSQPETEEARKVEDIPVTETAEPVASEKEECPGCRKYNKDKKIKNLISLAILLAGLFIGSLFVDVAQMVQGSGYSQKNLDKSQIFEADGKTWVAYTDPAVPVSVISDDKCTACDPSQAVVWLRRVLPTVSTAKINYDSPEGKQLISEFGIKTLPAFVFGGDLAKTDFYAQAKVLFNEKDGQYVMDTNQLGLPPGKYLATPQVDQGDATFGNPNAKVKVIVFSDFQCPYCKMFYSTLRDAMKNYQNDVFFDFKEFPLSIHPQANDAALAAACAQDQGKFWEYADKLYSSQSDWSNANDIADFKTYAQGLGLNAAQFNQCLDGKKDQSRIDASVKEASDLGLSGTPSIFINDTFESGVVSADQLKSDIETQLKNSK